MSRSEREPAELTADHIRRIDSVCDRFEDACRAGEPPAVADFLRREGIEPDAAPPDLLRELVRLAGAYPARTPPGEPPPGAGARIPGYEILDELGEGGMGVVYRAHEPAIGRHVAIKVLCERHRGNPAAVRRFLTEARVTGRLQHPGIPPVFEVGELPDGSPYLAMKLVEGRTGDVILRGEGPDAPGPGRLLAAFEDVCQAVAFAHSKGVIHRDLKPANVMVGAFGEVHVMDWGLAKIVGEADPDSSGVGFAAPGTRTEDGVVAGTLPYMPPEQARGDIGAVDRRSDVFGLGAILCVIMTGRPPFDAGTKEAALALAAAGEVGPAMGRLDACGWDPELVNLCKRCLSPDPATRPADAGAVAHLVAAYRAAVEERLREAEREKAAAAARGAERVRKRRWRRAAGAAREVQRKKKKRWRRVAVGLTIALLALSVAGFAAVAAAERRARQETEKREEAERQARHAERQARQDNQRPLARMSLDDGVALLDEGHYGLGLLRIAHALEVAPDSEEIQAAARALWRRYSLYGRADHSRLVQQFELPGGAEAVAVSPDGRRVLAAGKQEARTFDLTTGRPLVTLTGHTGRVRSAWFSPDGGRVVILAQDPAPRPGSLFPLVRGRVWDARTGELLGTAELGQVVLDPISPDGRRVASSVRPDGSSAGLRDLETDALLRPYATGRAYPLVFSGDGRRVVLVKLPGQPDHADRESATAHVLDSATGTPVAVLRWDDGGTDIPRSVLDDHSVPGAWCSSEDGRRFALGGREPRVWDAETGRLLPPLYREGSRGLSYRSPRLSPDGSRVVMGLDNGKATVWETRTGRVVAVLSGDPGGIRPVSFSPDGRRILTVSPASVAEVWDAATGRRLCALPAADGPAAAAFGANGRRVATATAGVVRVWDSEVAEPPVAWDRPQPDALRGRSPGGALSVTMPRTTRLGLAEPGAEVLHVTETASGKEILPLDGSEGFADASFSRDGEKVVATRRNTARVWDAKTGKPVSPLVSQRDKLLFAAFSPDGGTLVTTSSDGTARLWDARTGRPLSPWLRHEEEVTSAEFSPDGNRLTTATPSGRARTWDIGPDRREGADLIALAELVSGHRIDRDAGFIPLPANDLLRRWDDLRAKYPGEFTVAPAQARAWRLREVCDCVRCGDFDAAWFHFWARLADEAPAGP